MTLNSLLMMSLEAGALKVSGGVEFNKQRRYPWQPGKREPPQEWPLTSTVALNKFSGDTYQREYLPKKILTKPPGREGGEGARICKDSQKGKN